jgi:hypothetical protein
MSGQRGRRGVHVADLVDEDDASHAAQSLRC